MSLVLYSFEGLFQVWTYTNGHSRIVLRRAKSDYNLTRVDIMFKNIVFMQLFNVYSGIKVFELIGAEREQIPVKNMPEDGYKFYKLISHEGQVGYLVASHIMVNEDIKDYDDDSPLIDWMKA